jgi:predicted transcriptional regulator
MKPQVLKQIQVTDGCHKALKTLAESTGVPQSRLVEVALAELANQGVDQIQIMCDPVKSAMAKQIRELEAKLAALEKGAKRT